MSGIVIDPKDHKYFVETPGKDFSPARNKAVIEETIQETTKYFEQLTASRDEELGERIDILSSFGRYKLGNGGEKSFEKWAGKELHNKLIGEKILSKVRIADTVNKLQGNRKNSILI